MQSIDFADVERALAKIHHVPEDRRLAFKARLGNLKRLGAVPSSGGRGRKLTYSIEDAYLLAFAVELGQFGVDPAWIKLIIEGKKERIIEAFRRVGTHYIEYLAKLAPEFLAASPDKSYALGALELVFFLPGQDDPKAESLTKWIGSRAAIINIGSLKQEIDAALMPKVDD